MGKRGPKPGHRQRAIKLVNMSDKPVDLEDWQKGDKRLAVTLADWLAQKTQVTTAISTTDDGAILIDYALHGVLQPTVRVYAGKIIWPKGTDFDLMMAFLKA